jgi:hypothetical protein
MTEDQLAAIAELRDIYDNKTDHLYINWGIRCFYGAFDGKTERVYRFREHVRKTAKKVWPKCSVTYFPAGGFYVVFNHLEILSPDLFGEENALIHLMRVILEQHDPTFPKPTVNSPQEEQPS